MRQTSDLLIIGAGVIGAAVAYYCTQQGLSVQVVEAGEPAGETSSKGEGHARISDKTLGPEVELGHYTLDLYRGELAEYAHDWQYQPRGGVMTAADETSLAALEAAVEAQRGLGVEAEMLDAEEVRRLEPSIAPDLAGGAYYPDDARLNPPKLVHRLLQLAQQAGASLRTQTRVTEFLRPGDRVTGVKTTREEFSADVVVNAAGPWSAQVAALAGVDLPVEPRRGYVLVTEPLPPRINHEVTAAGYLETVGSSEAELQGSAVVEALPSGEILLGASRERVGFSTEGGDEAKELILRNAMELFPFLKEARITSSRFGFRPYSPDHLPIIGPDPRAPGLWHATGHEGAGVGLGAGTGKLLAQALAGAEPDLDLSPFTPQRFTD